MIQLFFTGTDADRQQAIEAEIDSFDKKFTALENEPLSRAERALLRTFLIVVLTRQEGTSAPGGSPTS